MSINSLFKNAYTNQELISTFETINFKLLKLICFSKLDVLPASRLVKHHDSIIKTILKSVTPNISSEVYLFSENSIRQIVIELQVQDIISQMLEHIHQINENIIQELRSEIKYFDDTRYLCVMPELLLMNKEQLRYVANEYSEAISAIVLTVQALEKEVKRVSNHDIELKIEFPNFLLFCSEQDDIVIELKRLIDAIDYEKIDSTKSHGKLLEIAKKFTMESEHSVLNKILKGEEFSSQKTNKIDDDVELF